MGWLRYANQGAVRNQPLSEDLLTALSFLPEIGLELEVFSGGQPGKGSAKPRVGSTRHDHGDAADVFLRKDGKRLDWANPDHQPIFQDFVRQAKANGITGIGAGDGYMQPGSLHVGFGTPAVWGAGGKGANAAGWLREAYHGEPGHVHKPNENQAIANDAMAAIGKAPVGRPTASGGVTTAVGGSGADTMAESGGLLSKFARTEDQVGGLLGMLFKNITPDRADSIRAGLASMQGINNSGVYNAAMGRMQGRRDTRSQERGFEQDQALQQQRLDAQNADRRQKEQAEATRRERMRQWVAQNAPEQLHAFDAGVVGGSDIYKAATGGGDLSAKEEQIGRLMETGLDRTQAVGVADGRFVVSRDPMDGTAVVVDKGTGQIVGGTAGQGQPAAQPQTAAPVPQPAPGSMSAPQDGFSSIDVGSNAEDAFGIEGKIKGAANAVTDAMGMDQPFPEVEKVTRNFNALNENILSDLANGYQRQPPVIIMKALQELQPRPGELFEGASSAQAKLSALRTSIKTEARSVSESLNRRQTPANRQEYEKRAAALDAALARIDAMSGAFGSGESQTTSGGVKWRIVE
ncbi:hypothetical protein [Sulfitobacter faviae]|uniref:hypothetical protein n=1 Tax=Sulfitobacter faviae TaxID=1775881 RepID=UPI00398CFD0A